MKIKLDREADALYIKIKNGRIHKTIKSTDKFLVDVDKRGSVIGFEILNYSKTAPQKSERREVSVGLKRILIPA